MKQTGKHIHFLFHIIRRAVVDGILKQGYRRKLPERIIIEPTNICSLQCSCCPHGSNNNESRPKGMMDLQTFWQIINNIDLPVKDVCLYLHGEPFLNKNLDSFVSQIDKKDKILTTIYSNGYDIDLSLLDKILSFKKTRFSFSMDILNKESYERIRQPAIYEKAIESLKRIDELFVRHDRKYEINMIVDQADLDKVKFFFNELFSRFHSLGSITASTRFPWPGYFHTGELEERISGKRKLCRQMRGGVSVYWNGDATLCSNDFSGKLIIGNLKKTKLSEVYNSPAARRIRKNHFLRKFSDLPLCKECLLPRYRSSAVRVSRPMY